MEQKVNFIAMAPTIAPVPEPGAWGVALGVFLIGFALLRRRSISRKSS
jgi:MYXO-CTERM domain-containing protein